MSTNDKRGQQVEFEDNEVRVTAGNPMDERNERSDKTAAVNSDEMRYKNADDIYGDE